MKLGGMILISLEGMKESCAVIRGFSFFSFRTRGREKRDRGERKQKKCEADREKQTTEPIVGEIWRRRAVSD